MSIHVHTLSTINISMWVFAPVYGNDDYVVNIMMYGQYTVNIAMEINNLETIHDLNTVHVVSSERNK
jgi:preprotein translocase subunit Sec63